MVGPVPVGIGKWARLALAAGVAFLAGAAGALAQVFAPPSVSLTNSGGTTVTQYFIATDRVFVRVDDSAANRTAGASNDTTRVDFSISGVDLQANVFLQESAVAGRFQAMLAFPTGIPSAFASPGINNNGQFEAIDGHVLTALYLPTVQSTATFRRNPVSAVVTLLTTGGADTGTYQINASVAASEKVRVRVADADENRSPVVADTIQVTLSVAPGGDTINTVAFTETGVNTGIFERTFDTQAAGPNSSDFILQGASGSVLTVAFDDLDDAAPAAVDTAIFIQPVASTIQFTDSAGTVLSSQPLPSSSLFVTVFDGDQNTDFATQQQLTVTVTSTDTSDSQLLTLTETTNNSGIFRNTLGIPVVQNPTGTAGNGTLETDNGATLTASYSDPDGGDNSVDTMPAQVVEANATIQFTNASQAVRTGYRTPSDSQVPTDRVFVRVVDADQNTDADASQSITVTVTSSGLVGGDLQSLTLTETGINTGIFFGPAGGLQTIRSATVVGANNRLELLEGDVIRARYVDPTNAPDTQVVAAGINVFTAATVSFIPTAPAPVGGDYRVGDSIIVEVVDPDQNLSHLVTEQVTVTVSFTGDLELQTLFETGPDTSTFRSPAGFVSRIASQTPGNGFLDLSVPATIRTTYVDPNDAPDRREDTAVVVSNELNGTMFFSTSTGGLDGVFFIGVEPIFVTLQDADENTDALTAQQVTITLTDFTTGDAEDLLLVETGINSGVFRNTAGLPSSILATVPFNGNLESSDFSPVSANYLDNESGFLLAAFATMRVTQTLSATAFTDSTGAVRAIYRIGVDPIFVTVTDPDENSRATSAQTITSAVVITNLTNGDQEVLTLVETGANTGVFRNTTGLSSSLVTSPIVNFDGLLEASDGDLIQVVYTDNDDVSDISVANAVMDFATVSQVRLVNNAGAPVSAYPLNATTDFIFIQVTDGDENLNPGVAEVVSVNLRHVPSPAGEGIFGVVLTETGPNTGIFRNISGIPAEVAPVLVDGILQSFDGAQIQASYTDNDDPADSVLSNICTLRTSPTQAQVVITDAFASLVPRVAFVINSADQIFVTVVDEDQDLNATTVQTIQIVLIDTTTGDAETITLVEDGPDSDGVFSNALGIDLQIAPNAVNGILETADNSTFIANYDDPTPGDPEFVFDSAIALLNPTAETVEFTDGIGTPVPPAGITGYLIGIDPVFLTVRDEDENLNGSSAQLSSPVTVTSGIGDSETLSLLETAISTSEFRSFPGLPLVLSATPVPNNGQLEVIDGDTIQGCYNDIILPTAGTGTICDFATVNIPPAASITRFVNAGGTVQTLFTIGASDMFVQVTDADENANPAVAESVVVSLSVSITGDLEQPFVSTIVVLTETGVNTGIFRSAGIPTIIDQAINNDGVLQVAGASIVTARYVDDDDATDTSFHSCLLQVPQVSAVRIEITTDPGSVPFTTPSTVVFIGNDQLYVVVEDIDENEDPTTTETLNVLLTGVGGPSDQVIITLVEIGQNSSVFINDGTAFLPAPVSPTTTGLSSAVDPVNTSNFFLETFDLQVVRARYVDPQTAADTRETTALMRVFEDFATINFSNSAGTPVTSFEVAPLDPLQRIFITVFDVDENTSASTAQSIIVTLVDGTTGDQLTVTLVETGPDTSTFRNTAGINSAVALPNFADNVLQTGDGSVVTVNYQDTEAIADFQQDTAVMLVRQGGSSLRLVDSAGVDRLVYRMINFATELIFVRVVDPDENRNPLIQDTIEVELESLSTGDTELVTLTETAIGSGIFQNTTGVVSLPACTPTTADGIVQGTHNSTLRATYVDPDDALDTSFDLATLQNAPSFATIEFTDATFTTPVTTFLIGSNLFVRVVDSDEDQDPCNVEQIAVTVRSLASGDDETVVLDETGPNTGIFVGPVGGLPTLIDPPVDFDGTLQVRHPTAVEARYVDNDNLLDQAVATINSVMFEAPTVACFFLTDVAGTPQTGTYGIGTELIFVQVEDPDRDQDYATQESISVTLTTTGTGDTVTVLLLETSNHSGIFRNLLPTPPNTVEGIPSAIATTNSTDATLQTSDGEEVLLFYQDPSDPTDICTNVATLELKPSTSTIAFTDTAGTVRAFYSINFDFIFVTVTDPDENHDPTLIETITASVISLFPLPATSDVEPVTLEETGPNTGVFRNIASPLPMDLSATVLGDGILQTGDGLDIEARYLDLDPVPVDLSIARARTFVASSNSTVDFTDAGFSGLTNQYEIGVDPIFIEVFDPDENVSPFSPQSVVVTVRVTATGDVETFVLGETFDSGGGIPVTSNDAEFFRNLTGFTSFLSSTGTSFNGVVEAVDGAFITVQYTDNDFPADTSFNGVAVRMVVPQTASSIRLLNQNILPVSEFLVGQDRVIVEVTDADQNGNPGVAESVIVTIDMGPLAFDQLTLVATEIGPNAGIFRTVGVSSVRITPPATGTPGNGTLEAVGDLPGGLGRDQFDVLYRDPTDGTDVSTAAAEIVTQTSASIFFTNAAGTSVTTYRIGVDRIFVRLVEADQNTSSSSAQTVVVTITDFGTGDFEFVTLTETGPNTGIFFNALGLTSVFNVVGIPGDGILQSGDPSDETIEAGYVDPDDPIDAQFDQAENVPADPNDRDGDGIPNAIELATPGMDPNDPTDATQDFDLDGRNNRTELVVDFTDPNDDSDNAPVAIITPLNVTLDPGVVQLDGTASFDQTTLPPTIGIVQHRWQVLAAPGTLPSLSCTVCTRPFFVARTPGTYTIQLTVRDADGAERSSTTDIDINDVPPIADAGPGGAMRIDATQTPAPGTFRLDGRKSREANGQTLTYLWTAGPGNTVGTIRFDGDTDGNCATGAPSASSTQDRPLVCSVDRQGYAVVRLTVNDGTFSDTDDVTFLAHDATSPLPLRNHAPTSFAGLDRVVTALPGNNASLDGSLSSDQDGDPLTFLWTRVSGPVGFGAVVGPTNPIATASNLAAVGVYTYQLQVTDTHAGGKGIAVGAVDTVNVIAQTTADHVPTANAGGPYQFMPLVRVQMNGTGSGDSDPGDVLTYQWTQVDGFPTALEDDTAVAPFATFYLPGVYVYQLVVTDAAGNVSLPGFATVVVGTTGNNPPVANAGVDQVIPTGTPAMLDGRLSSDLEGSPLTFYWNQIAGTQLLLSDRHSPQPTFTPTRAGVYIFELVVDDGTHFSPPARVTVSVDPPIANAGPDQNRLLGAGGSPVAITLDGTGSFDPIPGPQALTFLWSQVSGPNVTLSDVTSPTPGFSATVPGTYVFLLTVSDGATVSPPLNQNNATDSFVRVVISATSNTTPTAIAGPDQFVNAGALVTLNGLASFDADGNPLTFQWVQLTGSPVVLNPSVTSPTPSFIPPVGGTAYTFRLTVRDPANNSSSDQVTVYATGSGTGSGGGNPLPGPGTGGGGLAEGGSGGGCAAVPLYVVGDWSDHWSQGLFNLLLLLLPLLAAAHHRRQAEALLAARVTSRRH